MKYIGETSAWLNSGMNELWNWFTTLNLEEWFLLLGITASLGFLCMRGFGSRSDY